jgi:hypothetical protein
VYGNAVDIGAGDTDGDLSAYIVNVEDGDVSKGGSAKKPPKTGAGASVCLPSNCCISRCPCFTTHRGLALR